MKYTLQEDIEAKDWFPGEEIEGLTEIRHGQLGIIGELTDGDKKIRVLPGNLVFTMMGKKMVLSEEEFKRYFKRV